MLYNRALTLQEITQNYNTTKIRFGLWVYMMDLKYQQMD
jgi:hypothetical protein